MCATEAAREYRHAGRLAGSNLVPYRSLGRLVGMLSCTGTLSTRCSHRLFRPQDLLAECFIPYMAGAIYGLARSVLVSMFGGNGTIKFCRSRE
mgnify:CR=1 FL=1